VVSVRRPPASALQRLHLLLAASAQYLLSALRRLLLHLQQEGLVVSVRRPPASALRRQHLPREDLDRPPSASEQQHLLLAGLAPLQLSLPLVVGLELLSLLSVLAARQPPLRSEVASALPPRADSPQLLELLLQHLPKLSDSVRLVLVHERLHFLRSALARPLSSAQPLLVTLGHRKLLSRKPRHSDNQRSRKLYMRLKEPLCQRTLAWTALTA